MNTIPTILVPIDFTECSINALTNAIPIARRKKARIVALHVIEINSIHSGSSEDINNLKSLEIKYQNLLTQIKKQTELFFQFEIELLIKAGKIENCITKASEETNSFLIVIGTQGSGSKTSFLGSTARSIIREADCAVLAIPRVRKHAVFTKIFFPGKIEQDEKIELLKTISQNDDTIFEISELIKKENEVNIGELDSKVHFLENNLKEVNLKSSVELTSILKKLNQKTYPLKLNVMTILDTWDTETIHQKSFPNETVVPVLILTE